MRHRFFLWSWSIGKLDFGTVLKRQIDREEPSFDAAFTRYSWKEIVECVASVHKYDIVHSDLKPANFVLVNGSLKVIDFGIANLIMDHTVNAYLEHQVGTPNYMAPEALLDTKSSSEPLESRAKLIKLGKPSDIWSFGCILYQMVYGRAPFANILNPMQKVLAIVNPNHTIDYPPAGLGGVRVPETLTLLLRSCLDRDQRQRPTVEDLLSTSERFLYPDYGVLQSGYMKQEQLALLIRHAI
ncbi:Checkpoint protein kinase [Aspergillus sclerotialis]|uniref:Checkpoint protein kinase n=1 Tax=Aspergillus sclerotialis TaxID=2070753 RepID=A0A3A2ZAR9_9EURO|nr:Checkpoint protein kinase [Aspergillus sclerotialis]